MKNIRFLLFKKIDYFKNKSEGGIKWINMCVKHEIMQRKKVTAQGL